AGALRDGLPEALQALQARSGTGKVAGERLDHGARGVQDGEAPLDAVLDPHARAADALAKLAQPNVQLLQALRERGRAGELGTDALAKLEVSPLARRRGHHAQQVA